MKNNGRHEKKPTTAFVDMMGVETIERGNGVCIMELEIKDKHSQGLGFVHGGILAALIDHVGGSAAASLKNDDEFLLTSDINVSYVKPGLPPRVRFVGTVINIGKTLCFVEVKVFNLSPKQSLCTVGRLTLLRKKIKS